MFILASSLNMRYIFSALILIINYFFIKIKVGFGALALGPNRRIFVFGVDGSGKLCDEDI